MKNEKVSVVIPAYNEEKWIKSVLESVKNSLLVDEIIVVDDGSTDKTSAVAQKMGVKVFRKKNGGKASAIAEGIKASSGEIVVFLDADLINLTQNHLENLILPLKKNKNLAMTIGKFLNGNIITFFGQRFFPFISGQRGIRKEYFSKMNNMTQKGFGIEVALYKYAKRNNLQFVYVPLRGLRYVLKEQKDGIAEGLIQRLRMYRDIFKESITD